MLVFVGMYLICSFDFNVGSCGIVDNIFIIDFELWSDGGVSSVSWLWCEFGVELQGCIGEVV